MNPIKDRYVLLSSVENGEVTHGYVVFDWNFPWVHDMRIGVLRFDNRMTPYIIKHEKWCIVCYPEPGAPFALTLN